MRKSNIRKKLALLITLVMVLQLFGGNGFTFAKAATKEKELIQSFSVATGSAISCFNYYVGGPKANAANDGLTEDTPVLTISEVTDEINSGVGGEYTINILGNITEDREIVIGNGINEILVNIEAATGSAIILRDSSYVNGDLIQVDGGGELFLGDKEGINTNQLIIDGGYDSIAMAPIVTGRLLNINQGATAAMYANTILQNNVGPTVAPSITDNPNLIGGGVYNGGEFMMYGGEIRNNRAINGGGVNNDGDVNNNGGMRLLGGTISSNYATNGGGIYNNSYANVTMSSGDISNNVAVEEGGGCYNDGVFEMEGGSISNNTAPSGGGLFVADVLFLTGDAQIPKGVTKTNDIYLHGMLYVYATLTAPAMSMAITPYYLNEEYPQVVAFDGETMMNNIGVFDLTINDYELVRDYDIACLKYNGPVETYYINGINGADTNNGSVLSPYKTIEAALADNYSEDPYRECTLVLQDRVVLENKIVISRRVNIMSDGIGTFHPLVASSTLSDKMFYVENGTLTLGSAGTEDDLNPLIIEGDGDPGINVAIMLDGYGILNIYDGAGIQSYDGQILVNYGFTNIYGGFISGSSTDYTIINYRIMNMSGGKIDTVGDVGIFNTGMLTMSGGIIDGYLVAGIRNNQGLILSGSPVISSNVAGSCSIYQDSYEIYIEGDLAENTSLTIDIPVYELNKKILDADTSSIIANNAGKFSMLKANYGITKEGKLIYIAPIKNYYVDETKGTNGNGSLVDPFNTFTNAVNALKAGDNIGKIVLKSDVSIHETITLDGTVEIVSDGQVRTINRANDFTSVSSDNEVLQVTGHLTLGNSDSSGSDTNPTLILDGGCMQNPSFTDGLLVVNTNQMDIYPGVVLQNNNSDDYPAEGAALTNTKDLRMYGGVVRNNSGLYAGVYSESGSFTMNGGSIIDNDGDYSSGLYVHYSTATMNGGTIAGNTGYYAGVFLNQGEFTMNEGTISSNISDMSADGVAGVAATYDSEFVMNGGTISKNEASGHRFAGVYVQGKTYSGYIADSLFTMNGGSITQNNGYAAGVYSDEYSLFSLDGGHVGNNDGVLAGVSVYGNESFSLGGAPTIDGGDSIILNNLNGKSVLINSKLSSGLLFKLTYADLDQTYTTLPIPTYSIGEQLVSDNNSYEITPEDIDKFVLSDPVYAINLNGKVGTTIQDSWITFGNVNNIIYDGADKKVSVAIKNGSNTLSLNEDYSLIYLGISEPGSASAIIRGIGDYAGKIVKSYEILKYIVTRIITANPENQTFKVKDNMSAEQLLASIKLTQAQVASAQGGTMMLPVTWSMTAGTYNPNGGTYTYTGTLLGGMNVDTGGLTLTTQIKVVADVSQESVMVNVGSGEALKMTDLILSAEQLKEAKETGKDIAVSISDETGKEKYSWTFTAENLKNSKQVMSDVNLFLTVKSVSSNEKLKKLLEDSGNLTQNGLILNFGQDGVLPAQAGVKLYVGDQPGIKEGSTVFLYHYNKESGKLESLPFSSGYVVDKEGFITLNLVHCSDYVLLDKAVDSSILTALRRQISVSVSNTMLYVGGTKDAQTTISLNLPPTLELVNDLSEITSGSAIGGATASYRSGNKKVVTVDTKGVITAKSAGTTSVLTTVRLYSGKSVTFTTTVTVKKAYISFLKNTSSMKVGDSFNFEIVAYGLNGEDVVWTTAKKSILSINKETGKAKAVSTGTDSVLVTVNGVVKKIKVTVK